MKQLIDRLTAALNKVEDAIRKLDLEKDRKHLLVLEGEISSPDLWNDHQKAETIIKEAANLRLYIQSWDKTREDLSTTIELMEMGGDESEYELVVQGLLNRSDKLLITVKLNGEYDKSPAIMQLSAGVGGTDAADWTEMLERMYLRYGEMSDLNTEILEESHSEEAGIKSATIRFTGPFAFGKLKSEKGVHRLVRLSPFNSDNLRQTSFALVDVIFQAPFHQSGWLDFELRPGKHRYQPCPPTRLGPSSYQRTRRLHQSTQHYNPRSAIVRTP